MLLTYWVEGEGGGEFPVFVCLVEWGGNACLVRSHLVVSRCNELANAFPIYFCLFEWFCQSHSPAVERQLA